MEQTPVPASPKIPRANRKRKTRWCATCSRPSMRSQRAPASTEMERDGFSKPNRFGYAPDGYVLQIQARSDPTQPPSLIGSSPCFAGTFRSDDVRRPAVIQQPA